MAGRLQGRKLLLDADVGSGPAEPGGLNVGLGIGERHRNLGSSKAACFVMEIASC